MNTSDRTAGGSSATPNEGETQDFQHVKKDVADALGGARQHADEQFGQYRDSAADQIEALAQGAKSFVSEIEAKDTLGMSDYLTDMAESMTGLAGNLRGKSAEQLLHDAADLARSNPGLFIAGSIALGFGLSRFLKAGNTNAATVHAEQDPAGTSMPPSPKFAAQRPFETSSPSSSDPQPGLATGITPSSPSESDHPSDFSESTAMASQNTKGEL